MSAQKTQTTSQKMRLQKILAQAGIASRRRAEELIFLKRVKVNGQVVTEMGVQADPFRDKIEVDGKPLGGAEKKAYYLFYKPANVMVTRHDPQGRPTIYDYLKKIPERVNPVGRLDFDSEGLILLTNNGELHAQLTHPKHEVPKTYQVKISGRISEEKLNKLRTGVNIGGYVTRPCQVKISKVNPNNVWLEIIIHEGKNRQIRRMIEAVDCLVLRLIRVAIGPLTLEGLERGAWLSIPAEKIYK